MNYAIFRSEPIMTTNDLAQIGSHNQREKKAYKSNPDIKIEDSYKNIQLVPLNYKYVKKFHELTKEYEKQHNEKMKTERKERQRNYTQMVNRSRNCVADELLFTASPKFFDNMSEEDIMKWADTCMEFVYNDLGYTKEQILHATIHLDEKSPHIHCVVVPLVKKLDKRTNTERWTISKKQYIRDKIHLSQLQDKYHERLVDAGFDLERGIKGNNREHLKTKELKKTTHYYENKTQIINKNLDKAINDLNEKMKTTKNTIFDKEYVKVKKETFDSMNKVIKETKKVVEFQPKIEQLFNEVNTFTKSHQTLEKENSNLKREVKSLVTRNQNLTAENNKLKNYIDVILEAIKKFFRKILQFGNEYAKDETTIEVKNYYGNEYFDMEDVIKISRGTTKQDELFDYVNAPNYYKERVKDVSDYDKSGDFDICR
ncbi:MAG TPA: plasmid recombination protein [Candidatus Onthousia faecigallinarum]|nr:plasmid recombination protein [Candidatus Onthousia faecigallinarum]